MQTFYHCCEFSSHTYFLSSCQSLVLPMVSNAFVKSTKTIYRGQSCSMHFSWVVAGRRSCPLCSSLNESHTVSLAPPLCDLIVCSVGYEKISCRLRKEVIYLGNYHILFGLLLYRWSLCWHPSMLVVVVYPLPWPLLVGGVRCSRLWSTSQLLRPSGQQCSHSGGVCPQIQGRQCGAYVGAVEEMMCVVCVDVTEGA